MFWNSQDLWVFMGSCESRSNSQFWNLFPNHNYEHCQFSNWIDVQKFMLWCLICCEKCDPTLILLFSCSWNIASSLCPFFSWILLRPTINFKDCSILFRHSNIWISQNLSINDTHRLNNLVAKIFSVNFHCEHKFEKID